MPTNFSKAFTLLGMRPNRPLAASTRQRSFSKIGCKIPPEVEGFYENCNGGRVPSLGCRFYPLPEAVDLAGAYDFFAGFAFLPFFVSEDAESDPCMVGLELPLKGYVFQLCHDGPKRVHAPSLTSFLRALASQVDADCWHLEDAHLVYPKRLTASEQRMVQRLLERSLGDLEIEYEPALLIELALSMLTDEDCISFLEGIDHPDHNARHQIAFRLKQIGAPAARRLLAKGEDELKGFVKQAIKVLKKAGFTATTRNGVNLHVAEGNLYLNVSAFFDRRNAPDCWDYLLERVRDLSGRS